MSTSTLTRLAPTQVALEFSIDDQELAAAEERAFRKLSKDVRLPGFRKGRVPRKIFEQNYGSESVTSQAVDDVVPQLYARALEEHALSPVQRPTVEVLEESDGRPSRLKATVEVRPEITLPAYRGITVSRPLATVSESEVDRSLTALAKERGTLIPVDRPAAMGDVATIDYEGKIDGTPFEGGRGENEIVELSEGRFLPEFLSGIVGMRAGESTSVEVHFPAEYRAAELAGKSAEFTIALKELKEYELPALDDEFAKQVSHHQSIAELRADVRRRLEAIATARARQAMGNAIVSQLLAAAEFPLPPSLVEAEVAHLSEDLPEDAEPEARESLRPSAESHVKATLLIEEIAKAEKITASPADVALELEVLARRYGQPVGRIRKALGNNVASIIDGIVRNKTLDFLIDNAVGINEETSPPLS
ncbi:MAG: trigger factor [Candidatus Eremiobacteraeota bacterium]|nr:trigger factor [Candidatus Eremiobacteraeota bacterium]